MKGSLSEMNVRDGRGRGREGKGGMEGKGRGRKGNRERKGKGGRRKKGRKGEDSRSYITPPTMVV